MNNLLKVSLTVLIGGACPAHAATETLTCRQSVAEADVGGSRKALPVDEGSSTAIIYDRSRLVMTFHNGRPFNYGCAGSGGKLDCVRPDDALIISADRAVIGRETTLVIAGRPKIVMRAIFRCVPL